MKTNRLLSKLNYFSVAIPRRIFVLSMREKTLSIKEAMKNVFSLSTTLFLAALICSPFFASATPGAAPVDGGLSLLVAAGIGYTSKKLASNKKRLKNKDK